MTSAALCEKTTEVTASEALTAASAILSSRTQLASQQQVAQIAAVTTAKNQRPELVVVARNPVLGTAAMALATTSQGSVPTTAA